MDELTDDMMMPRVDSDGAFVTDGDYWSRLNSNAFDVYDDIEAKANEWEAAHFAAVNDRRGKHNAKKGPKRDFRRKQPLTVEVDGSAIVIDQSAYVAQQVGGGATTPGGRAPPVTVSADVGVPRPAVVPFNAKAVYTMVRKHGAAFDDSAASKVTIRGLSATDEAQLAAAYTHMLQSFDTSWFHQRYQGNSGAVADILSFGNPVPSYFANVGGESMFRRKALSIAGLRNLVRYGPTIFEQLRKRLFVGAPGAYGKNEGLNLMRTMTGNVVDLDTTVLRCSDAATRHAINASNQHKGLPTHASTSAFSSSEQAADIARNCARPLLEAFVAEFKLSEAAANERRVSTAQLAGPIPTASDNSTRGHSPVWHYMNAGQDSFHANVPTMEDVVGALLRAPFRCVEHYCALHMQYNGAELEQRLKGFFEDCVADSCFNMKWKAIEEYGAARVHEGTVVDVLQRVQAGAQGTFTLDFFDADNAECDAEVAAMVPLVAGQQGRDATGLVRGITAQDVRTWAKANAAGKPVVI